MTILHATKHAWLQRDTLKSPDWILPKHSHPSFESNQSVHYSLLLHSMVCTFSMLMPKQLSSTETAILNSTLNSLKDSSTSIIPTKSYGSENRFMALNKHLVSGIYFSVNISSILVSNPAIQTPASTSTLRKASFCLFTLTIFSFSASTTNPAKLLFNSWPHNSKWRILDPQRHFLASTSYGIQTLAPFRSIKRDTSIEC